MEIQINNFTRTVLGVIAWVKLALCFITCAAAIYFLWGPSGMNPAIRWDFLPFALFFIAATIYLGWSAIATHYLAENSRYWNKTPAITRKELERVIQKPVLSMVLNIVYIFIILLIGFILYVKFY
jgi:hypothetical protein